jgi:PKD repeat protein
MTSVPATAGGARGGRGVAHRTAAGVAALAAGLVTTLAVGVVPAQAVGLGATGTSTASVTQGSTTRLSGLAVSDGSGTLAVTVATTRGQLSVDTSTGVTLAYGNSATAASVAFTGTPEQVNAALAATDLVAPAGSAGQSATVSVMAYQQQDGIVYGSATGHFYEYVASSGITWDDARTAAGGRTFLGKTGYLVSITSSGENDIVTSRIPNALNVWIGAKAVETAGAYQREWRWDQGPDAGTVISRCTALLGSCDFVDGGNYANWADGEPNNSDTSRGGEWVAVTNWNDDDGRWNDLASANTAEISGYVVEYGDGGAFSGVATASSVVAIQGLPGAPTGASGTSGLGEAWVAFAPPASNGGSSITGYTVTASPGGATAMCSGSPCRVTGLTGGTSYTFTVTATNALGTGPASSPSAAVVAGYEPTIPTGLSGTPLVGQAYSSSVASAGYPAPTYTVVSGSLPAGLTLNETTGAITGTPTAVTYTVFTIVATNAHGSAAADFQLLVALAPCAIAGTLGDLPVNQAVSATLTSMGFPTPAFAVTGGSLPTGLSLSATGVISGTPSVAGPYSATVTATNVHGSSSATLTGTVLVGPHAINGTLPQLMIGSGFSATLAAPAYPTPTFAVTAGTLPAGVSLSSAGVLSGTPTATGQWSFEVTATNSQGAVSRTYSGHAGAVPAAIGGTVPSLVWGTPVAVLLTTSGDPAPTFAVTAGALPAGLSLDGTTGALVGTPTVAGSYSVTVTATNTHGSSDVTFTGTVAAVVPGAPSGLSASRGDGKATVSFDAPTSDGGAAITGYEVSIGGGPWAPLGATAQGASLTGTVEGLTNGVEVELRVRAVNAVGAGPASGPSAVRPVAPPPAAVAAPTAVAGVASVTVTWAASTGRDVTGYTVIAQPGPATCEVTAAQTACVIGAQAGVPVRFSVVTHSRWGDSEASWPSAAVTPTAPPVPQAPPAEAPTTLTTEKGAISTVAAGETVVVVGTGFAPYSTATVVIYSTPRVLGTIQTDGEGTFRLPVVVPRDLEAGAHTFVAYGVRPSGEAYAIRLPVVLPVDGTTLARTGAASRDLAAVTLLLLGVGAALRVGASRASARARARA